MGRAMFRFSFCRCIFSDILYILEEGAVVIEGEGFVGMR